MNFQKISPLDAKAKIASDSVMLIDIRDNKAYQQEHIPNAMHVTATDLKQFANTADKTKPILVYCYHGVSSQQTALYLVQQGFQEVYSLEGGFEKWKSTLT